MVGSLAGARLRGVVAAVLLGAGAAGAAEIGPEALSTLPPADVVILGEVHDNALHHALQAQAVAVLSPRALVFEMLTPEQAGRITPELRADPQALEAALGWHAAGWPDFAMYHPIFLAAPEAMVVGAALPRAEIRRAMTEPATAVFGDRASIYGLDRDLPAAEQAAREADQQSAHCDALPAAMLPFMVTAQRLRDAALARAALAALTESGGPVAVITGSGHADRRRGIPAALAQAAPAVSVLSLAMLEASPGPDAPYDVWLVTPPQPRPDPCAAFR